MYMPAEVEMMIGMLSPAHPDQPAGTWDLLRKTVDEGCKNIDPGFTQSPTLAELHPPKSETCCELRESSQASESRRRWK